MGPISEPSASGHALRSGCDPDGDRVPHPGQHAKHLVDGEQRAAGHGSLAVLGERADVGKKKKKGCVEKAESTPYRLVSVLETVGWQLAARGAGQRDIGSCAVAVSVA